jgi:hypothetical protein
MRKLEGMSLSPVDGTVGESWYWGGDEEEYDGGELWPSTGCFSDIGIGIITTNQASRRKVSRS